MVKLDPAFVYELRHTAAAHTFLTKTSYAGASSTSAVITPSGQVGVGTATPTATLHTAGSTLLASPLAATTAALTVTQATATQKVASLTASGGQVVTVDAVGQVGVGIAIPTATLHTVGSTLLASPLAATTAALEVKQNESTQKVASFAASAGQVVTVDKNGQVGVGTATPTATLHTAGSTLLVSPVGATTAALEVKQNESTQKVASFTASGGQGVTVDKDGKVGVGTATPGALLHVHDGLLGYSLSKPPPVAMVRGLAGAVGVTGLTGASEWASVSTNWGLLWDGASGTMVAPVKGVYGFAASLGFSTPGTFELRQNGATLGRVGGSSSDPVCLHVYASLDLGDVVDLTVTSGDGVIDEVAHFHGALLYAIV